MAQQVMTLIKQAFDDLAGGLPQLHPLRGPTVLCKLETQADPSRRSCQVTDFSNSDERKVAKMLNPFEYVETIPVNPLGGPQRPTLDCSVPGPAQSPKPCLILRQQIADVGTSSCPWAEHTGEFADWPGLTRESQHQMTIRETDTQRKIRSGENHA